MHDDIPRIATSTPDLALERQSQLREMFPEAWGEDGLDFSRLRELLGDLEDERSERYQFSWAGKTEALRLLQTPSRATLHPAPEESLDWDETQNLFIEGDNLEALKLLYKPLFGRVKMIYIDPPYNTGNDFIYPDNFADPLKSYLIQTGQRDDNGDLQTSSPDTAGRVHSRWLSMLYPRLYLARQLLKDDGVIFVSIDDNEVHHLRLLMNQVFGEENFVAQITIVTNPKGRVMSEHFASTHDYALVYARLVENSDFSVAKSKAEVEKQYPEKDNRGIFRSLELRNTHRQFGKFNRKNLYFPIYVNPKNGAVSLEAASDYIEVYPNWEDGFEGCWSWGKDKVVKENSYLYGREVGGVWKIFRKSYAYDENGEVARRKLQTVWADKDFR